MGFSLNPSNPSASKINKNIVMEKVGDAVVDMESLAQSPDECCSGSPKIPKALSRKSSMRPERHNGEELEVDETLKRLLVKVVPAQVEQLKQPLVPFKTLHAVQSVPNSPVPPDSGEGKNKRLNRLTFIHPRKILLFFATLSSVGTMVLIYFTLAID
ncbi:uncharacterized protein LOC121967920 isoform X1 [Zingiber officinale]|uniref:uncharacterized protein LOC121967920 isoform X1 n=2 Tax=Zingiber officinale TaxID=94328 RepID=UPI001C4CD46B|nr:uncharacterized protein LOC121967920 isoform X1 [Zingiber officinale]